MRRRLGMLPRAGASGAVRNAARSLAERFEAERAVERLEERLRVARGEEVLDRLDELGDVELPVHDPRPPGEDRREHLVSFWEDEEALAGAVVPFVAPVLAGDGCAVLIGTEVNLGTILSGLEAAGTGTVEAGRAGTLRCLEAGETLAQLLDGDRIAPERVHAVLGAVLSEAARGGRPVRVYGEMVALLWARGDVPAVLELESLWGDLARTHPFSLLCGYPAGILDDAAAESVRAVCDGHDALVLSDGGSAGRTG